FQKCKQPARKTLHSRLFLLDKTEKATHFRHFSKKKALHNCIICAVRLWLWESTSSIMYNHTFPQKNSVKKRIRFAVEIKRKLAVTQSKNLLRRCYFGFIRIFRDQLYQ
ncbi:MAG: hypothetical protein ACLUFB_11165, partial [Ruminococcus sp.]|uniref:hypothetical protein n=1 Tax=Ruminococcus sp. TaxID=41978 RepID=UPI003991E173